MNNQGDRTGKCHKNLVPFLTALLAKAVLKMLTSLFGIFLMLASA